MCGCGHIATCYMKMMKYVQFKLDTVKKIELYLSCYKANLLEISRYLIGYRSVLLVDVVLPWLKHESRLNYYFMTVLGCFALLLPELSGSGPLLC